MNKSVGFYIAYDRLRNSIKLIWLCPNWTSLCTLTMCVLSSGAIPRLQFWRNATNGVPPSVIARPAEVERHNLRGALNKLNFSWYWLFIATFFV